MPLTDLSASALSTAIASHAISCRELMQATLARIHALNPTHNAIVNLAPGDVLLTHADACDAELAQGHSRGWLHGVPVAIKDLSDAAGFPTTRGSPLLLDNWPARDGLMVSRMRAAGAIVIGKTNTPELGLGSHTFNVPFGATRNAWDASRSAGGSSGGAAVALSLRMLPVADGSDFMGSLRNPAGWNHVFGMRPSQGRVPANNVPEAWVSQLGTEGPMARSMEDLGRLLATQSGHDAGAPLSMQSTLGVPAFANDAGAMRGLRIGWLGDLAGYLPMEPGVLDACRDALRHCEAAGAVVEEIPLGMDPAQLWECWLVWRRALTGPRVDALLKLVPDARDHIKPEALWEYDQSRQLPFSDFMQASQVRTAFYHHLRTLFAQWDVLALPSAQCWPFPVEQRWPQQVAGRTMDTYHRWMEVTIYATLAGVPALCVPAGFHENGRWPMGLQLLAPMGADAKLLQVGAAYENLRSDFIALRPA